VLSEAVLVLVIDQLTVLGLRFAHAVALHRHPSQQRERPGSRHIPTPSRGRYPGISPGHSDSACRSVIEGASRLRARAPPQAAELEHDQFTARSSRSFSLSIRPSRSSVSPAGLPVSRAPTLNNSQASAAARMEKLLERVLTGRCAFRKLDGQLRVRFCFVKWTRRLFCTFAGGLCHDCRA
jgi:hypothetical protein